MGIDPGAPLKGPSANGVTLRYTGMVDGTGRRLSISSGSMQGSTRGMARPARDRHGPVSRWDSGRVLRSKSLAVLVVTTGILLTGCASSSSSSPSSDDSGSRSEIASDPDAIEQAQVVLGGEHTYAEIQAATDNALRSAGEGLTDENRSRAWSSVLATKKGLVDKGYPAPDSMSVMLCVPGSIATRSVELTEAVAYCSLEAAGIPESEW